eukprot:jgi/Ulvmu1/10860/UM007_0034.1
MMISQWHQVQPAGCQTRRLELSALVSSNSTLCSLVGVTRSGELKRGVLLVKPCSSVSTKAICVGVSVQAHCRTGAGQNPSDVHSDSSLANLGSATDVSAHSVYGLTTISNDKYMAFKFETIRVPV